MRGSCLCGKVRLDIAGSFERSPEACHCTQCRKQSGHFLAAVNVRRTALTVQGSEHVKWYRSSDQVERGFCSNCGSTLFWNPTLQGYEWIAVALGTLDEASGLRLAKHTFVGDKGDYYAITDGIPQSDSY